jgi:hypothetical protein
MNFRTHNQADVDTDGTSWTFSTIQATRAELVKAFGEPMHLGGSRVQYEWAIQFEDGTVATVYDWKKPEFEEDTPMTWNIGTHAHVQSGHAVSLVHDAFRTAHGLCARSAA